MNNEFLDFLEKANKIAILTHRNPDGDAFGSALAVYEFLSLHFKDKQKAIYTDYITLSDEFIEITKGIELNPEDRDFDAAICVDLSDKKLLGIYETLFDGIENSLCIDHHKSNNNFCKINIVNCLSSNCEHIYNVLNTTGFEITKKIGNYLCVGIMTDTNGLTTNSVNADTYRTVASLEDLGVNVYDIRQMFFAGNNLEKYKIIAKAMSKVEFLLENKVMFINLMKEDFDNCGLDENDTVGIINQAFYMKDAYACFLVTPRRGKNHVSMRSVDGIDVSVIAESFGGGGHLCASACDTELSVEEIKEKILNLIKVQLIYIKPKKVIF